MLLKKPIHLLFVIPILLTSCKNETANRPNIIILFADDLGYADLGYKQEKFITPNIDSLKAGSVVFENARVSVPTCSPSRASILTGKHAVDLELYRHIPSTDTTKGFSWDGIPSRPYHTWDGDPAQMRSKNWLDTAAITYAERLKEKGYYNAFFGKWHLGEAAHYPIHQGFDEQHFVTPWGAPTRYYPPYFVRWEDHPFPGDSTTTYLTDSITNEVVRFIEGYDQDGPFQISLFYYNVHHPHVGKIEWVRKYRSLGYDEPMAQYAAMVSALDESVGKIMHALNRTNRLDNTVIVFTSDQGGFFENPPFAGGKMQNTLYEGGTRVPFFIKYGDHYQPQSIETPIFTHDLFSSLLALAGYGTHEVESKNTIPLIERDTHAISSRPILSYRSYENQYVSLLDGNWKFVGYRDGTTELFNLQSDIQESVDLSEKHPGKIKKYKKQVVEWEKEKGVLEYSGFQ